MTLTRQFSILVLLQIVVALIGALAISTTNIRYHLKSQMESRSHITADALAMSIKPALSTRDLTLLNGIVNDMFNEGYYREISVEDAEGNVLAGRSRPLSFEGLPLWFVALSRLDQTPVVQEIRVDNKLAGRISVESHPGQAYRKLWDNLVETLLWFLLTGILLYLVTLLILRRVRRSLSMVENQAYAISERHFTINGDIPRQRELKQVTEAMNTLSMKVQEMLRQQSRLTESLRRQLFFDQVTGLHNRHSFETRVHYALSSPDHGGEGTLMIVQFGGLKTYRDVFGYQETDALLRRLGSLIERACEQYAAITARLTGADFVVYLPQAGAGDAIEVLQAVQQETPGQALNPKHSYITGPRAGIATVRQGNEYTDLMHAADIALRVALRSSVANWHVYGDKNDFDAASLSADAWRDGLHAAIVEHRIEFDVQTVREAKSNAILHQEMLARLPDGQGGRIAAGVFIPIADRVSLRHELDREILDTWFRNVATKGVRQRNALNLGASSLLDQPFREWLVHMIGGNPVASERLTLEISVHGLGGEHGELLKVVRALREQGVGFAFDHFGAEYIDISYLSEFLPDYIKLEGVLTQRLMEFHEYHLYLRSLIDMAHSLDILVIAKNVETEDQRQALVELGVDGLQGFLLEEPPTQ